MGNDCDCEVEDLCSGGCSRWAGGNVEEEKSKTPLQLVTSLSVSVRVQNPKQGCKVLLLLAPRRKTSHWSHDKPSRIKPQRQVCRLCPSSDQSTPAMPQLRVHVLVLLSHSALMSFALVHIVFRSTCSFGLHAPLPSRLSSCSPAVHWPFLLPPPKSRQDH